MYTYTHVHLARVVIRALESVKRGKLELGRVTRAYQLLLDGPAVYLAKWAEYGTTDKGCGCEDAKQGNRCKHVVSKWLHQRAVEECARQAKQVVTYPVIAGNPQRRQLEGNRQ